MDEMGHSPAVSVLAPEFDDFLFAPIGEDRNGTLSVVSALARLDIDPWQEAARLTRLPRATATERLAELIASLPGGPAAARDPGTIAARLIGLLPRRASSATPSATTSLAGDIRTVVQSPPFLYAAFIVLFFALGGLGIAASHRPAAGVDNRAAPTVGEVIPPAAPQTTR